MKKMLVFLVIFGLAWGFNSLAYSQEKEDYKARIAIESENSHLKIKAYCLNNTSEEVVLRHQLKVLKSGRSGRTNSFQSGSVCLQSQEEKCVTQSRLRVSSEDEYQIKLEVYKDGKLIAKDFLAYPRASSQSPETPKEAPEEAPKYHRDIPTERGTWI